MTVTCPRQCGSEGFENPGALAAHLIDAHDMAGSAALATAREVAGLSRAYRPPKPVLPNVSTTKEAPMTCKICGGDHRSDNKICPKHGGTKDGGGNVWKRRGGGEEKKTPPGSGPPKPPKKAAATSGNGLLSELDALRSTA